MKYYLISIIIFLASHGKITADVTQKYMVVDREKK